MTDRHWIRWKTGIAPWKHKNNKITIKWGTICLSRCRFTSFSHLFTDIIDAIKQCKTYNLVIRHQIRLDRIIRVKMTFHCHWLTPKINPHHEILQLRMVNFNSFTMLNKKKTFFVTSIVLFAFNTKQMIVD